MQTSLHTNIKDTTSGQKAESILRSCVHCGFCNATCPTYQLLGDELEGPRGRIYLIKQLLETGKSSQQTQQHLDHCLTCRSCETTCPSGVEYHSLLEIGRCFNEKQTPRHVLEKTTRKLLRLILPHRKRMQVLVKLANYIRRLLPKAYKRQLPVNISTTSPISSQHERKVIMPAGCAQDALAADINYDAQRLLDKLGISCISPENDSCCGAVSAHLNAEKESLQFVKKNIDAWWPHVDDGAEAIVSTASACG